MKRSDFNNELKPFSKELRREATKEENRLWHDFLRSYEVKFHRQQIIGNYIVDFYSLKLKLAIELDGSQHYEADAVEYDRIRTEFMNEKGIEVLRLDNREINKNFDNVCEYIINKIKERQAELIC